MKRKIIKLNIRNFKARLCTYLHTDKYLSVTGYMCARAHTLLSDRSQRSMFSFFGRYTLYVIIVIFLKKYDYMKHKSILNLFFIIGFVTPEN